MISIVILLGLGFVAGLVTVGYGILRILGNKASESKEYISPAATEAMTVPRLRVVGEDVVWTKVEQK